MSTTELKDTTNLIKEAIYNVWEENLVLEDFPNTLFKRVYSNYISSTPTFTSTKLDKVQKIIEKWEYLNQNLNSLFHTKILSTIPNYESKVPLLLNLLDKETLNFCSFRNILSEATIYYKLIYETFKNIKGIKITLQSDYEINNLTMVRFDVKIRDEIDNIIREEDKFYENIRKLISIDSMMNFVLTTQVV